MTEPHRIRARPITALAPFIGSERTASTKVALDALSTLVGPRRIVNLTSDDRRKGGVYEILRTTLPYLKGSGIDVCWFDVAPEPRARAALEYFHVLAHGVGRSDWKQCFTQNRIHVDHFSEQGRTFVRNLLRPDDIVVCHDTQTALLAQHCLGASRIVLWRAHIGSRQTNEMTTAYWDVFGPPLRNVFAAVFYTDDYVPEILRDKSVALLPAIDPSLVKNQVVPPDIARSWLAAELGQGSVTRYGGLGDMFSREATLAVQLSRWDPLKQMPLVTEAFCLAAVQQPDFQGVIAGPPAESASEKHELNRCLEIINVATGHPPDAVQIVVIEAPGSQQHDDVVRHLQAAADIVVQASLREGFGLTVTEAMLKGATVVAAETGGIPLQIRHLQNGLLMAESADAAEYANTLVQLSANVTLRAALGAAAMTDAQTAFAVDRQLREGSSILCRALRRQDTHDSAHR